MQVGTFDMARRPNLGGHYEVDRPVHLIPLEDVELIERIKTGETHAYGILVRKYQDRIFNTCWRICGHMEDARDLTQDAFLKAFQRIHSFRHESAFPTWLFRIAVNLAISHKRSEQRHRTFSLDQNVNVPHTQADELTRRGGQFTQEDPAESVAKTELQQCILAAMDTLDDEHRAVVVLRDIEGFSYDEISGILDIPTGTVKSRLHRARVTLREALLSRKK